MAWRLHVVHSTGFQYESEVLASFNEARMTPMNGEGQYLIQHKFNVSPAASLFEYSDYFETQVKAFDVQLPHTTLKIVVDSIVETHGQKPEPEEISWDSLKGDHFLDQFDEYLHHSNLVDEFTAGFDLRQQQTPLGAVTYLNSIMREKITYTAGVTHVYSPASEAWHKGAGVCQDFSHVSLSILRSAGIPARYISGYLYTGDGNIGETVIGESHSWVEAWVGQWLPFDPTNGRPVAEDHVVVAKGRDYHDVSPLKGIFSGGASRKTDVVVSLTRLS
jgi:transglutaminase-like putative cysteine protease